MNNCINMCTYWARTRVERFSYYRFLSMCLLWTKYTYMLPVMSMYWVIICITYLSSSNLRCQDNHLQLSVIENLYTNSEIDSTWHFQKSVRNQTEPSFEEASPAWQAGFLSTRRYPQLDVMALHCGVYNKSIFITIFKSGSIWTYLDLCWNCSIKTLCRTF